MICLEGGYHVSLRGEWWLGNGDGLGLYAMVKPMAETGQGTGSYSITNIFGDGWSEMGGDERTFLANAARDAAEEITC